MPSEFIKSLIVLSALILLTACSKDSNPAIPPGPEGDVIGIVERNPIIRVGLLSFTPQKHIYISITRGTFNCYTRESLSEFASGFGGDVVKFSATEDTIKFTDQFDAERDLSADIARIEASDGAENGFIQIGPSKDKLRSYRGKIRLILEGKNLLAVNELPLEDYLSGVVPAEMNPEWPEEALMAQAIASRTYALFNLRRYDGRGFDVADDYRSQLYGGWDVETERSNLSVIDTNNKVLVLEDTLACVVFHEESHISTASNLDVWPRSEQLPQLVSVPEIVGGYDYSGGGQYESWSNWSSFVELKEALNRDGETYVGKYLSCISILGISDDGRVQSIDISGEKNPVVDAMTLSFVLNRNLRDDFLPSNDFTIKLENDGYRFEGSGSGHGVGMNQWGAYNRALNNQGHEFILSQYYPGCVVREIPLEGLSVVHNTRVDLIR